MPSGSKWAKRCESERQGCQKTRSHKGTERQLHVHTSSYVCFGNLHCGKKPFCVAHFFHVSGSGCPFHLDSLPRFRFCFDFFRVSFCDFCIVLKVNILFLYSRMDHWVIFGAGPPSVCSEVLGKALVYLHMWLKAKNQTFGLFFAYFLPF